MTNFHMPGGDCSGCEECFLGAGEGLESFLEEAGRGRRRLHLIWILEVDEMQTGTWEEEENVSSGC